MIFTHHTMQEILPVLQHQLKTETSLTFYVLDPDLGHGYAGEKRVIEDKTYRHRGYKAWTDLAEILLCKMCTPKAGLYPLVALKFEKLETQDSFHLDISSPKEEKYGIGSNFSSIQKMEEPAFLYYYKQALSNAKLSERSRVLNLGINTGDELGVIKNMLDIGKYDSMEFVGIDHSKSAIAYAKTLFTEQNVRFYVQDINSMNELELGKFDLLISIGTLQSPGINFKPFFMGLVQDYLEKDAAIILGFPNSRWIGGEMVYGAKAPNYAMSEMSLLYSDVIFCKKYLQQHKFRVTLTGKQYIFLTATKIL